MPEEIGQIVTTHSHCDHHGANKRLKALSGAPVGMGPLTAEWFAANEMHLTWFDQLSQDADVQPADIIYNPGETVKLSGISFDVVHLPGHAPDCIGFFQPDSRVLICADALWPDDVAMLHTAVHGQGIIDDAEAAIHTILDLNPLIAIPGHGGLITDVPSSAENALRRLDRFRNEPGHLAWHICRRFVIYGILTFQPIQRQDHIQKLIAEKWIFNYLPELNIGRERPYQPDEVDQLFNNVIDEFIRRGLVIEKDGLLTSIVPK